MIAAAKSCGFDPVDDNEADALAILSLALMATKQGVAEQERYL
jgi:hypothetical protein